VNVTTSPLGGTSEKVATVLAHPLSAAAAWWLLALVAVAGVIRLLCEWQRRTTLVALVRHAPAGTVVVQERGLGGPAMWVQVGYGPSWPAGPRPGITGPGGR
jgi:hypothetical protein